MAYIAAVPPIRFINITSSVGTGPYRNNPDDVLILRAFMIYLQNFRKDLSFTNTRLTTLAGSLDGDLRQMILHYKAFKAKVASAGLPPEERGNDRVVPQDVRFALASAAAPGLTTTIMSLNLDVKPLAGYGDNIVDIMCNLFPIRGWLTIPPLKGSALWDQVRDPNLSSRYWRDLARNKISWKQWLPKQQEEAMNERQGANVRSAAASPTKLPATFDEDNELFALLAPYHDEMKDFYEHHTRLALSTSPNPSAHGQPVTVKISVTSYGGQAPQGSVRLWITTQELLRLYGRQSTLTPDKGVLVRLVNGSGTFTYPKDVLFSPASPYLVIAEYWPTSGFLVSNAEITHEVR